jgi:hypothetical protein
VPEEEVFFTDIQVFLGLIPINSSTFLAVVTNSDLKGTLNGSPIFEIREVELIEFTRDEDWKNVENEKMSIKKLFSSGFYYSFSYLLTRPIHYSSKIQSIHDDSDERFYWNFGLYKELITQGVEKDWFIPMIQGFVSIFNDEHVGLSLISRRSCERVGTRYNCRGIDDLGHVANFVETEQILTIDSQTFSYLQIRGSVPIYWEQRGLTAHLSITRSHELSVEAFQKHIDDLLLNYGHVTMINLLTYSKSHESELTLEWKKAFDRLYPAYKERMAYIYFDFHSNCKGQKFHKINLLVEKLSLFSDYYGYFSSNGKSQKGVIRTNCLDCLDRTNVVQGKLAWDVLLKQLRSVNKDFEMTQNTSFTQAFKNQWADNGDKLSLQYTGTGSTISSITRTDSHGFSALIRQGFTSLERFYNANVEDSVKQDSIEHVLRKKNKSEIVNKMKEELEKRKSEYSEFKDVKVRIVTWNLDKKSLSHFQEISDSTEPVSFVFFAFQQGRDMHEFQDCLRSSMLGFSVLKSLVTEDLSLFIFVDDGLIEEVSMFDFETFHLPSKASVVSNKKCFAVSFKVFDSSFCFLACHLASGTENSSLRREQINFIQSQPFVNQPFDFKFLFGDLNFRVDLGSYQIIQGISRQGLNDLLKSEQLTQNLKFGYLAGFKEAKIQFNPNFPYVEGTDDYDLTQKRGPCWRERILFEGKVESLLYGDLCVRTSHRPVEGIFLVKVKKENFHLKKEVERVIFDQLSPAPLGSLPKKIHPAKDLLACNQ